MIYRYRNKHPVFEGDGSISMWSGWMAPNATLLGDVHVASEVSIWFNAVIRADNDIISIGKGSNIQEHAVLHVDEGFPINIGEFVTIGHHATIHGCTIEDGCLIGINAVVLNGAVIGEGSIIGANALVTEGVSIPPHSVAVGIPAKIIKTLTLEQAKAVRQGAQHYIDKIEHYKHELMPVCIDTPK